MFKNQMTVPTNIPETPMAQSDFESIQDSKEDSTSLMSMEVHHVLNNVMDIKNEDEIESFSKWMTYRGHENSLTYVLAFIKNWIIFMALMTTEWME